MKFSWTKFYVIAITMNILSCQQTEAQLDERIYSIDAYLELKLESEKQENLQELTEQESSEIRSINPKKPLTLMFYVAADNDLNYFAGRSLKQLEQIGSNEFVTIIVQINTPGHLNPTKRYVIKQGRRLLVQDDVNLNQKLNSGSPYTLIDFVKWTAMHYPADEYGLIFWNHGSGAIDPNFGRTINPCDLFYLNPTTNLLEIDRGVSYITLLQEALLSNYQTDSKRGICFDDTFKSYINNSDLEFALREICTKVLNGQKLGLIGFDACLMSMIEIASISKDYAQYMTASEEIEYGTGIDWERALKPFLYRPLTPKELAIQIVVAYEQAYQKIINDYTHSALDLSKTAELEQNIDEVAYLLHLALESQTNHSVTNILRKCKSTQYCTCFDEPSYIDIGHFYQNILQHLQHMVLNDKSIEIKVQTELYKALQKGLLFISQFVIENRVGQKLKMAQGIAIYFPERAISQNYLKSPFALSSNWSYLLTKYIFG